MIRPDKDSTWHYSNFQKFVTIFQLSSEAFHDQPVSRSGMMLTQNTKLHPEKERERDKNQNQNRTWEICLTQKGPTARR